MKCQCLKNRRKVNKDRDKLTMYRMVVKASISLTIRKIQGR